MRGARPLSTSEVKRMLKNMDGPYSLRNRAIFILCINTGMRIGEALSLTVGQVWQRGRPSKYLSLKPGQTKMGRSRTIPLNAQAREAIAYLMAWKQEVGQDCSSEGRLFVSKKGMKLTIRQYGNIIADAVERAGLTGTISSHSMRKTAGTSMMKNGVGLPVIAEILGHKNLHTLICYLGVGDDAVLKAVNGLKY